MDEPRASKKQISRCTTRCFAMPRSAVPRAGKSPAQPITEKKWVASLVPHLAQSLQRFSLRGTSVDVRASRKLAYTYEIHKYPIDTKNRPVSSDYETDLLVSDILDDKSWSLRVIVECKLGSITSHDALTYSAKAATHKHVHPYLRYGVLLGEREHYAIPARLVKHGAYFDFMVAWRRAAPNDGEWQAFTELLGEEITASRSMLDLLITNRSTQRKRYHIFRRRVVLK